ncbi:MAG: aminotransferase class III-fold pyridoxal phosphate-dependent enzyme [Syntrophales bacterium]
MILAILQARVSSSRLPGKVLKPILGKPMLQHQIERTLRSRKIDRLIVATSTDPSDDGLELLCKKMGLPCYRGDLDDVLDRYYQAAQSYDPRHVVRLTGDCPLIDPFLIDKTIEFYLAGNYDYATNSLEPTFPDGLDVEIFSFPVLQEAWKTAQLPSEREHVTQFICNHSEMFRIGDLKGEPDLSHHRWTVDESQDLAFVTRIYEGLYPEKPDFATGDILLFLERHPEILALNQGIKRNEGLEKSIQEDKKVVVKMLNIKKSLALQEHAKERIPGLSQLFSKRPDLFSYGVWPGYFSRAKGIDVWDLDGNRYLDMSIGGIGANVLGYGDPDVDAAVKSAIDRGSSSSLNCPEDVELADLLCELHPWAEKVRYARTGGESMAVAVRIARAYTGRDKVAFCGYHGWHDWYLAANLETKNALGEHLIPGLDPSGVPRALKGTAFPFRYNQIDELETIMKANAGDVAAIVMEPIRSEPPAAGFFDAVRDLATRNGSVLIIDEISAGFRMNTGGAHLILGIKPDIAVFSKALGNGYPIAAIIGKSEVMETAQRSFISSTYWTERIGPTAAIATIKKYRQHDVGNHLMRIGQAVQDGWRELFAKHELEVHIGGIPPLSYFAFEHEKALALKALFVQGMLERGVLATNSFYAMYAHSLSNVTGYLEAMDQVLSQLRQALADKSVEARLLGQPSVSSFKRLS